MKALNETRTFIKHMETVLAKQEYLVGSQLTLADVAAASVLVMPYKLIFDKAFRGNMNKVNEWFTRVSSLPQFVAAWGTVRFCTQAQKALVKHVEEKKQQPAPKQKKSAEPQQKEEEDEPAEKPKKKEDPFPPTSFVMDSWKKLYCNTKNK